MENQWRSNKTDLLLSFIIALSLPFIAKFLYLETGALIPLIIYYGLAWGIVKLRRGSTGYFNPITKKYPKSFLINVTLVIISLIFAFQAKIISTNYTLWGMIMTGLVWATLNASSEQLLWIYIFESWDLYYPNKDENNKNFWIFRIIGLLLFSTFIGMIHTLFWLNFLHTVDSTVIFGIIFVLGTSISGFMHIWVWRESNNMIYTFIPHLLLNLVPIFWTKYSILPYLWK